MTRRTPVLEELITHNSSITAKGKMAAVVDTEVTFLVECSDMLLLPQPTLATALVYFHRHQTFYEQHRPAAAPVIPAGATATKDADSLASNPMLPCMDAQLLAATCLHLACKQTETHRKLRDIVNVSYWVSTKRSSHGQPQELALDNLTLRLTCTALYGYDATKTYWTIKDSLTQAEMVLLRILAFKVTVNLPYTYTAQIIQDMQQTYPYKILRRIAQMAFIITNDILLDRDVYMQVSTAVPSETDLSWTATQVGNRQGLPLPDSRDGVMWILALSIVYISTLVSAPELTPQVDTWCEEYSTKAPAVIVKVTETIKIIRGYIAKAHA
ncbi:hypothetical protein BASA50_004003 [Batrachochytrium salamandrivorans]|uniref:Cyclin N-terminal domain-containing protein n=1 Tax=Batrachochytrium salamandrivorans TaxID=1357716 RepID=A0ABQ8FGY4_9FUNG|nr:hypothetical protein BASA50_004003 [Batrachochytrium salamandrivorans]KAH9272446.1 hypothetical protein BASA83_005253 [Batrachochytrium salamandrivorans]